MKKTAPSSIKSTHMAAERAESCSALGIWIMCKLQAYSLPVYCKILKFLSYNQLLGTQCPRSVNLTESVIRVNQGMLW